MLEKFADIGRIYLTPEDPSVTRRRRKMGGNKRVKYEDGWVEFMDKKKARRVAAMLNGQPIGSKNRGFYEHDLWTIKYASPWRQCPRLLLATRSQRRPNRYLSKFKWRHLTGGQSVSVSSSCSHPHHLTWPYTIYRKIGVRPRGAAAARAG